MNRQVNRVTLEVYDPTGASKVTRRHAPRLADLNGAAICEVSNGQWEYDRIFPVVREALRQRFPAAHIIPYTEVVPNRALCEDLDYVSKKLREKGCQAVIVGNAA